MRREYRLEATSAKVPGLAALAGRPADEPADAGKPAPPTRQGPMTPIDEMKAAIARWQPSLDLDGKSDDFVAGAHRVMVALLLADRGEPAAPLPQDMQLNGGDFRAAMKSELFKRGRT